MEHVLEEAIDSYNSVFMWYNSQGGGNCRICGQDFTLKCMMLDSIQIAGCYIGEIIKESEKFKNREDAIVWKYIKKDDKYTFYPMIDCRKLGGDIGDLEDDMREEGINVCGLKKPENTYSALIDDVHIYQTCQKVRCRQFVFSPTFIVDMWVYMNSTGRKLEVLQDMSKIFCAGSMAVTHKFLSDMLQRMKCNPVLGEKRELSEAVHAFVKEIEEMVEAIRYITRTDSAKSSRKEADILNSLEKVCIQFNNAYKKKNGSRAFYGEPVLEFDKKLADYTRQADVWDRDKMVRGNTVEKYLAAIKTEAGLP